MKRRVFVTGGAHGIGKGIVKAFARQGDEVVFCDLDPVLGAQTAAGTGARFCQLDVTDAVSLHIPADTRSAFPVISVQSPVSIQCCWQS